MRTATGSAQRGEDLPRVWRARRRPRQGRGRTVSGHAHLARLAATQLQQQLRAPNDGLQRGLATALAGVLRRSQLCARRQRHRHRRAVRRGKPWRRLRHHVGGIQGAHDFRPRPQLALGIKQPHRGGGGPAKDVAQACLRHRHLGVHQRLQQRRLHRVHACCPHARGPAALGHSSHQHIRRARQIKRRQRFILVVCATGLEPKRWRLHDCTHTQPHTHTHTHTHTRIGTHKHTRVQRREHGGIRAQPRTRKVGIRHGSHPTPKQRHQRRRQWCKDAAQVAWAGTGHRSKHGLTLHQRMQEVAGWTEQRDAETAYWPHRRQTLVIAKHGEG